MIVTGLLIDHSDAVSELAAVMEREWPDWYHPQGASARADLEERLVRDGLPLGIVAFDGEVAAGTAALTVTSGGLVTERSPWIGGLLVDPAFRRRGVAAALLARSLDEARRLGFARVYALTAHADALFQNEGWALVEAIDLEGEPHRIYAQT
ncbi:GNAT family N-acetyltransferase [Devosia sediminis]|uniref:GNAT family N-acetyltransferase n=1 Tax=Devosia sediminis TaxID=2798801 RepID=A0A934IZE5_9HYPH|nr:GNAT family N-acetyltransferase [Devosia sediminis]MBJ3784769.1 GNAT family N-acetyltransferase [Devosia sediminis]